MSFAPTDAADERVPAPAAPRSGSRLMADLVRAMRAATEESRVATLDALRTEAGTFVESVRSRSADEAAGLRRAADEEIGSIRERSEAEIPRVRAETDTRIAER